MNDITPTPEYEVIVDKTLAYWKEAIYDGVLIEHVRPAVQIYAHASLPDITEPLNVAGCFPLAPPNATLFDHYGNAIFTRLSAACTSIHSALQAVQVRTDGHSAIAIARRSHESLWQTFWLSNPDIDAEERVRRLLALTEADIKEAIRLFSHTSNSKISGKLAEHLTNIKCVAPRLKYTPKKGRDEYTAYYEARANDPMSAGMPSEPEDGDGPALAWSMMSNMTHPNMVFDLITQTQPDYQDLMDRLQIGTVSNAVGCACNISTTLMEQAQLPDDQTDTVNRAFRQPVFALAQLLEMCRERQ